MGCTAIRLLALLLVVSVSAATAFLPGHSPFTHHSAVTVFGPINHGINSRRSPLNSKNQPRNVVGSQLVTFAVSTATTEDNSATLSNDNNDDKKKVNDKAAAWRAQAESIRKEAEKLDSALTLQKIETLERKLSNKTWTKKNPDQVEGMQRQLKSLQDKLAGKEQNSGINTLNGASKATIGEDNCSSENPSSLLKDKESTTINDRSEGPIKSSINSLEKDNSNKARREAHLEENPLSGYDQCDLDLYTPVAIAIEEQLPSNATMQEKLIAFRATPELQEHFQEKIRKMLVEPMEDMKRLETLKQKYLASSSSVERNNIKRELDQLENYMENDSPFIYSDTIIYEDLLPLEEAEIEQRIEAVSAIHPILQALYKKRCGVDETADLRLAIEMDHYEPQLQLLEQVRHLDPVTDEVRHELRLALLSLPLSVRNHFAKNVVGLEIEGGDEDADISEMITTLLEGEGDGEEWISLEKAMESAAISSSGDGGVLEESMASLDLPEYRDLDFMDRSRYVKEFIPSLTRLELIHPSKEDMDKLIQEVFSKKGVYMVTSKPERVIGGYYIPGRNLLSDSEEANSDQMVARLQEELQKSSVKDKIDLFYIQDPSPPTDEEYEVGVIDRPVLVATAKNREELYNPADPVIKATVTLLGFCSVFLFAIATTAMQPIMKDQIEAAAAGDLSIDVSPILSSAYQVAASVILIQTSHEIGHRLVAWRDKFEIGLPTFVPSIQIGLQGGITPFKSPPPNNKSLFDFAMAGPVVGLVVSLALLVTGLEMTTSMDLTLANQLPAFPATLLRSSALGGGMVEYFLGKGVLTGATSADNFVVPLHPFAIAGFVGMLSNALALLPLGNTDGGRVAQTMFGRRGAYLVKLFTTFILCAAGIVGLDEPRLFLSYILFAMIWQRDLEAPTLNEADELDFSRGLLGIGTAIVVFLALIPMIQ